MVNPNSEAGAPHYRIRILSVYPFVRWVSASTEHAQTMTIQTGEREYSCDPEERLIQEVVSEPEPFVVLSLARESILEKEEAVQS